MNCLYKGLDKLQTADIGLQGQIGLRTSRIL